jgi:hypothetical protein
VVLEQHPLLREAINVRGLEMRVAHATQGIPALIVGENENDIGPLIGLE